MIKSFSSDSSDQTSESSIRICSNDICVITDSEKEIKIILDVIDKIDDPETRVQYLERLRKIIIRDPITEEKEDTSLTLKNILKSSSKNDITPISTRELKTEINQLKNQIKQINESLLEFDDKIYDLFEDYLGTNGSLEERFY